MFQPAKKNEEKQTGAETAFSAKSFLRAGLRREEGIPKTPRELTRPRGERFEKEEKNS